MTTITQTNSNNYLAPLDFTNPPLDYTKYHGCYTGTPYRPDVVTIFLKARGHVEVVDEQVENSMGYSPLNFLHAVTRIIEATKVMFLEIWEKTCFNKNSEFWNAFKNGVRGIIPLVPILGNATLFIYDKLRTTLYIHPKLGKELSDQQEVLGMAFDGKPVFSIPLSSVNPSYRLYNKDSKDVLALAEHTWLSLKQDGMPNTLELADRWRQMIVTPPSALPLP